MTIDKEYFFLLKKILVAVHEIDETLEREYCVSNLLMYVDFGCFDEIGYS